MNKNEYRVNLVSSYLTKLNLADEIQNYFSGSNILVTGGAGAIGSNLVIALSELVGDDGMIIVLDNLSAIKGDDPIDFPSLSNVMFVTGDVRSDIDLKRVIRERPTIIYHLAAFFANQNSVDYPETSADVDINAINQAIIKAKNNGLQGILDYTEEPLVSVDFNHDSHSCIVDGNQTRVSHKRLVKMLVWCDNEWGFANRMIDTAKAMANTT